MQGRTAIILAAAAVLAGAASAAPMSARDYATGVASEVEFQNMTCLQLLELDDFLEELRTCGPPGAEPDPSDPTVGMSNSSPPDHPELSERICVYDCTLGGAATRTPTGGRGGGISLTFTDPSQRVCRQWRFPQYRLTHELYDSMGSLARRSMDSIGVTRNLDYSGAPNLGRSVMAMASAKRVISSVQQPIRQAMALKNCPI